MYQLDISSMDHDEAASRALLLVLKLQATNDYRKTFRRLLNSVAIAELKSK